MIDRIGRDRLATALVNYMNRRIRSEGFSEIRETCTDSRDSSLVVIARDLWSIHSDIGDEPFSGDAAQCRDLARQIAFLKSDDELVEEILHAHTRGPYAVLLVALIVGIAGVLLFGMSTWLIPVIWIGHAPFALLLYVLDERHLRRSQDRLEFAPFRDRGQWESRRHLISDVRLPARVGRPSVIDYRPLDAVRLTFWLTLFLPMFLAFRASRRFVTVWLVQ